MILMINGYMAPNLILLRGSYRSVNCQGARLVENHLTITEAVV